MFNRRQRLWQSLQLDVAAWTLLALGLLVACAVASYEPKAGPTANLLGLPGYLLADRLSSAVGLAEYAVLACWLVVVFALFQRERAGVWGRRLVGWLVLVPVAAWAADFLGHAFPLGPIAGGGGFLGAWLDLVTRQRMTPLVRISAFGLTLLAGLSLAGGRELLMGGRVLLVQLARLRRSRPSVAVAPAPAPEPVAAVVEPVPPVEPPKKAVPPAPVTDIAIRHLDTPRPAEPFEPPVAGDFVLPSIDLLDDPPPFAHAEHESKLREKAALLEKTFADFGLTIRVVGINTGPVLTQYELALETGLRVNKVTALADDIALNLKVPSVRIVAPIPGKGTVGIEVPNEHRAVVGLKELLIVSAAKAAKCKLPLFIGKDTEGRPLIYDLAEMPHLLIAGRTGTGKSVCLNAIIASLLMTRSPDECKFIMIDPKMLELSEYGKLPHLLHPVVKDMKKAEALLAWAVDKMEERYDLLSRARVRGIAGFNELGFDEICRRVQPRDDEERRRCFCPMPYIVIIIDEMGDLMMQMKKEVEAHIIRLAQKSRAAGIHLILATQKPTVDVITGLIKSNLPARICFQVSSRSDSRVVLDEMGGDRLLGKGDMLFLQPGTSQMIRAQGSYLGDAEIGRIVEFLECEPEFSDEVVAAASSGGASLRGGGGSFIERIRARDDVYEQAIEVVVREGRGSVSLLQRALGIGYGRGARLIDFMAEDGIVGTYNGSQAREVIVSMEEWQAMKTGEQLVA